MHCVIPRLSKSHVLCWKQYGRTSEPASKLSEVVGIFTWASLGVGSDSWVIHKKLFQRETVWWKQIISYSCFTGTSISVVQTSQYFPLFLCVLPLLTEFKRQCGWNVYIFGIEMLRLKLVLFWCRKCLPNIIKKRVKQTQIHIAQINSTWDIQRCSIHSHTLHRVF